MKKVAHGVQNRFPNLNTMEVLQYWKQQKKVVIILCPEKSNVMICLLARLSIINHAIRIHSLTNQFLHGL